MGTSHHCSDSVTHAYIIVLIPATPATLLKTDIAHCCSVLHFSEQNVVAYIGTFGNYGILLTAVKGHCTFGNGIFVV